MEAFAVVAVSVAVVLVLLVTGEVALRRSGFRSLRRRTQEDISVSAAGRTFRGGARLGLMNATWPLAQLCFDRDGAVVRIGPIARTTITRSKVVDVKRVRAPLGTGIRFVGRSGEYDSSLFWTFDAATVLQELRTWGWPVPE
ncbi:MAG: hypothetical protein ACRDPR_08230 [Nocardioidaceae bacterium]